MSYLATLAPLTDAQCRVVAYLLADAVERGVQVDPKTFDRFVARASQDVATA